MNGTSSLPVTTHPIDRARATDLPAMLALLRSSRLTGEGLSNPLDLALVVRQGDVVVACAVVERYATSGLLRSVAVAAERRGGGIGRRLVAAAIDLARSAGLDDLYLLTETAAPLFARLGFTPIVRSRVPMAVQASLEFTSVCPASAQAMQLPLGAHADGAAATRAATDADAARIAEVYNEGIVDRLGTFETRLRTMADVTAWFDGRHPLVVTTDTMGTLTAFASSSTYRTRECYSGIAEFSVYVARSARGQGLGRVAMDGLVEAATAAGFWKLISRVFVENDPSRRLLASCGFREVGVYKNHARLDGVWRDVVIVEKLLADNLTADI